MFLSAREFPRIVTVFDLSLDPMSSLYSSWIRHALKKLLPADRFNQLHPLEDKKQLSDLPFLKWFEWGGVKDGFFAQKPIFQQFEMGKSAKGNISIFLLSQSQPNASKFFYDMMSRWLVPGKRMTVGAFFSTDFQMPDLGEEVYSICEMVICPDNARDLEIVKSNLPILEAEIRLGLVSVYHANRILEIKGLSADEKTTLIQEQITALVQKKPRDFDYDIFSQMQHFLVMCREEFRAARTSYHMSRLITLFYLFRKMLRQQVEVEPSRRFLTLKLMRARLHLPFGVRKILAIFVGVNFLKENELFEERHLMKALSNYIPSVRLVEDSYFVMEERDDKIHTIYLEVEKGDGEDFSLEEVRRLRQALPEDLKSGIEHLMRPLFMPRNEEEVMRGIVTLSQQLRYIRDIPQLMLSFDEQTDTDLTFTVILVRIVLGDTVPIQQLFQRAKTFLLFIPDRIKKVGAIRKKYLKEAIVFRVRLPNVTFVRDDHCVDLYKARLVVVDELQKIIGEMRDFNGGMISKQIEIFLLLKQLLDEELGAVNTFLLENFFHSISPEQKRSVLSPELFKTLFLMLPRKFLQYQSKNGIESEIETPVKSCVIQGNFFLMMQFYDPFDKQKAVQRIEALDALPVCLDLQLSDRVCVGYIFIGASPDLISEIYNLLDFSEGNRVVYTESFNA